MCRRPRLFHTILLQATPPSKQAGAMECKDETYDPDVNLHSDDSEQELNNFKDACSSVGSPFENKEIFHWDGFTHNRLETGGGPQADNPTASKNKTGGRTQKTGTCMCCGKENVEIWHGNRYRCHIEEKIKEHAGFCESCATGYDEDEDPVQCPIHSMNPWPKSKADTIPLEPVWT
ncbi:uncharacterized protein LOC135346258 [Halichondria panicea]|uniref:uncharacterized protein LOC135346258 n=1 Tax=Halichondria panicea TaxID=6063 RepID=UPI00312B4366